MDLKNKKFVFFDMDGILIDTEGLYYSARKTVLAKYGFPFTKEDNQNYIAKGFPHTKKLLQQVAGDKELGEQIFNESIQLYNDKIIAGEADLKPGTLDLLKCLQEQNIASYVTSSATKDVITLNAKNTGIKDYFTGLISGDDVKNNKPAPDIYLHALQVTNAKASEAVIFEDSPSGIESAIAAKIDVVIVPDLIQPDPELIKQAVAVLDSLEEAISLFK